MMTSFSLHELGWADFQALCHTAAREILGQTVNGFLDNRDGGRDGAFIGTWAQAGQESFAGEFVFQAKHSSLVNSALSLGGLSDEFDKAERLAAEGRCDVYVLMTNARVTGQSEQRITEDLRRRGIMQSLVLSETWFNQTISESPRLRMLVPRLYGLGDLTQILDERAYQQARAVLDSMRTDLAKLVRTATYEQAASALHQFGFVLLVGAPATGKTTIAGELSLAAADAFDTHVVTLEDPRQFADRWNPSEKQLFWLDDVFGATQLNPYLASSWQRLTPKIKAAIEGGSKFVLTSRSYILRQAWSLLKPGSFPLLEGAQVVVDVTELAADERRQILYNHLKHGAQPRQFVRQLVPSLETLADHPGFSPELARRLADPLFTRSMATPTQQNLKQFFDQPRELLADTFAGLDVQSLAALGLVFLGRGWLASPIESNAAHSDLLARMGGDIPGVASSLAAMDGSLVVRSVREGESGWSFAHPTMIDAYADRLREPEMLHFFVEGFGVDVLLDQTTCGDVEYENTIVLPRALWPRVMARLEEPTSGDRWISRSRRLSYIANQTTAEFQRLWVANNLDLLEAYAVPGLMLDAVPENDFICRLFATGVLPEAIRSTFANYLIEYCISGVDGAVMWQSNLRGLLNDDEVTTLRDRLFAEVVPWPGKILSEFVDGVTTDEDPDDFTLPIEQYADALEAEFDGDPRVQAAAEQLREARLEWISDNAKDDQTMAPVDRSVYRASDAAPGPAPSSVHRSVFDDLVPDSE